MLKLLRCEGLLEPPAALPPLPLQARDPDPDPDTLPESAEDVDMAEDMY